MPRNAATYAASVGCKFFSADYFAQLEAFSHQQAREVSAQVNLAPSAGTYGYTPNVSTLFGIPRAITPGGVTMDLDRVARTVSQPEDPGFHRATLNTQIGALTSALEHGIPEQQFSTEEERAEGISAAKALAMANAEGQRIYTIDQSNRDEALAALNLSGDTTSEIRQAVNAGRMVTTHTDPVAVPGWQGAGYVVLDPETGSGAWLIEGGMNGGFLELLEELSNAIIFSVAEVVEAFSNLVRYFKAGASALIFALDVISTVFDDSLNIGQKVVSILISLMAAIVTSHLVVAALAAFFFAAPFGAIVLAALITVTVSLVARLLTLIAQGLLALRLYQYYPERQIS